MKTVLLGAAMFLLGLIINGWLYFFFEWGDVAGSGNSPGAGVTPVGTSAHVLGEDHKKMLHELFKFAFTAILVGGAALIYHRFREQAEIRSLHRRRVEQLLREFIVAYNEIKFLRRELRRAFEPGHEGTSEINQATYVEHMRSLNRCQLHLEEFKRLVSSEPSYLGRSSSGPNILLNAEKYLGCVIEEYESRELPPSTTAQSCRSDQTQKCFCSPALAKRR